jgi:hypothetical protein
MSNSIDAKTSDRRMTLGKLSGVATTNQMSVAWTLQDTQILSNKFRSLETPTNSPGNKAQEAVYTFLMNQELV